MSTQTAPDIDALVGELLARRTWSRDRLVAHVSDALRALLRHAVSTSPYYRETLGPRAGEGEIVLEELPTLPKQTLMEEWDRIVTDPRLRLGDAERFLEGRARAPSGRVPGLRHRWLHGHARHLRQRAR